MKHNNTELKQMDIYWANLCILNKMEGEKMEYASHLWQAEKDIIPKLIYLGDTEEVKMYEQLDNDIKSGKLNFDLIVSSRFDVFCSKKYLQSWKKDLVPLVGKFPIREELSSMNILDPDNLFQPLVLLPHFIMANTNLLKKSEIPDSLEQLMDPKWAGKVYLGSTDLPSGKSVLFSMWYLYGKEGLETCVKNWRQRSAPSAARHGIVKDEFPIALLPGIFGGSGPQDKLMRVTPKEGTPILPSYAAIKKSPIEDDVVDYLSNSVIQKSFLSFYRDQALAYPASPEVEPPEELQDIGGMFFPPWDWILQQDMEYFEDACQRVPLG